jgi:hypothetical protein
MAEISIKLASESYQVKFGYGAFKALALAWDLPGINSVAKKIQDGFPAGGSDEITIPQADLLGDLVMAGIINADKSLAGHLDRDELVHSLLFENPEELERIMAAFSASFPKQGNPQPPVKRRQKKRK